MILSNCRSGVRSGIVNFLLSKVERCCSSEFESPFRLPGQNFGNFILHCTVRTVPGSCVEGAGAHVSRMTQLKRDTRP